MGSLKIIIGRGSTEVKHSTFLSFEKMYTKLFKQFYSFQVYKTTLFINYDFKQLTSTYTFCILSHVHTVIMMYPTKNIYSFITLKNNI